MEGQHFSPDESPIELKIGLDLEDNGDHRERDNLGGCNIVLAGALATASAALLLLRRSRK